MDGQLSDHPLAELIRQITGAHLSGALRLERGRVKAVVYFVRGHIIAALSNLRAFRLVEMLRRAGVAGEERLSDVFYAGMSDEQASTAIVRAGVLGAEEMRKFQTRQTFDVLREALGWTDGEWSFHPRVRLTGDYQANANVPQLLVEWARKLPHENITRRMGDEDEAVSPVEDALVRSGAYVQLVPNEAFVLSRVYGQMSLGEVVAVSGLPEEETRRAVYALALGGLLERAGWTQALPAEALGRARSADAASEASTRADERERVAEEVESPQPVAGVESDPQTTLEELFERAGGASHYEVLGVARNALLDDIKRVYYSHAKRFHPDLFRRDADEPLQQRIEAAFAKVAQAYEVLKDSTLRASYDIKLATQKPGAQAHRGNANARGERDEEASANPPADSATPQKAEQNFQWGLAALQQNDYALARKLFGAAASDFPKQARYRAYFGHALMHDKQSRRQAESELLAAISLDAGNALFHVMLAELYVEVNLRRKAEDEVRRALIIEPGNSRAHRLHEELRRAG